MRTTLVFVLALGVFAAREGAAQQPAGGGERPRVANVQFDASGWPIVPEDGGARAAHPTSTPSPAPPASPSPSPGTTPATAAPAGETRAVANDGRRVASGMQLGSPLLDVFQATRSPGAFHQLGGVIVWWRLVTFGPQGEQIGVRDVTHVADTAFADRDRIEHSDGRVYRRIGGQVSAQRQRMPWPTLVEPAQHELALFGLHLRAPWCFADGNAFVVTGRDVEERNGERFARVLLERRPPRGSELIGPEAQERPNDRFELLYEPSSGLPRELVHRFASSAQTRRVLLDDWRDVDGVRVPHRRTYVDAALRPTTRLELLRIERQPANERDFRPN